MLAPGAPTGVHADLETKYGCTDPKQSPCAVYAAAEIDAILQGKSQDIIATRPIF